jgi:septation ring formation regulator EzrA
MGTWQIIILLVIFLVILLIVFFVGYGIGKKSGYIKRVKEEKTA